jgi:Kef-type K+ transport system membrane component KefB
MTLNETFLLALLIIFTVPWALWRLFGGTITLPLVVVQIVVGIVLGPGVMGQALPVVYQAVFLPEVITILNGLALWSVMLFVFVAGLELDLTEAWAKRAETAVTSGLALIVPFVFGAGVALILLRGPGWVGASGQGWQAVLGIGMACAVTALPILVLFLGQLGLLREPLGQRVLRYASLDDLAIWAILALILLDWDRLGRQGLFVLCFLTIAPLMRRLIPRQRPADRWFTGLIWLIACALAADWAGLHFMVGAFLSGVVLEARWFDIDRVDRFREVVLVALMPVYFLSTGLRTDWEVGGWAVLGAAGMLTVASVAGKLIGIRIAGRILGWSANETAIIGWLLQTKALIMIIFSGILLDKQIISSTTFTALLVMALISTLLTMPVVTRLLKRRPDLDRT